MKTIEITAVAKILKCRSSAAGARLAALGYTEVCGRCCGTGHYSFNQINGTTCFGCGGSGRRLAKLTEALANEAAARIAAGELETYFATNRAANTLKKAHEALWTTYSASPIAAAYTAASKANRTTEEIHAFVDSSPVFRAQSFQNKLTDAASSALYDRKANPLARLARIEAAHDAIRTLNAAWVAWVA